MERGCLHGRVIENSQTRNPLTLCSVHVRVWVYILGDPQSVQLRNTTTTITFTFTWFGIVSTRERQWCTFDIFPGHLHSSMGLC